MVLRRCALRALKTCSIFLIKTREALVSDSFIRPAAAGESTSIYVRFKVTGVSMISRLELD